MNLNSYFEEARGTGILSTANGNGHVNAAIYARPHVIEDGRLAFIMRDRLSHKNLQSNPHAAYLFHEDAAGYKGIRLHLTKSREESGTPLVKSICRRCRIDDNPDAVRYMVVFDVIQSLPLIGSGVSAQ